MSFPAIELSVVVPTLNEAENVAELMRRLDATLVAHNIGYEVIVVDDHSSDGTGEAVLELAQHYPVRVLLKQGRKGKAQSLLEGFAQARASTICMIDGDLQYPPESIPVMFAAIMHGADVVVANRAQGSTSGLRKISSHLFRLVFAQALHRFDVDVQSGLKVFRTEIIRRITVELRAWAFDVDFLTQARDAGYRIASVDSAFNERAGGETKVQVARVGSQLLRAVVEAKLRPAQAIPFPATNATAASGFHYKGQAFVPHTTLDHGETALWQLSARQIVVLLGLVVGLCVALVATPPLTVTLIVAGMTCLYFADLLFNLFVIYQSFARHPEIRIGDDQLVQVDDVAWPPYTIFCPLYNEWAVLPQFVAAMSRLDYPQNKLQVMLLLEENDPETIAQARQMELPAHFHIVVVPDSLPKTKPKACNYGLSKATGEYIVIYDAEDVPDPLQLKKAVLAFGQADPATRCIQAKLNYYNPDQNLLTRVFTAEYSCWFDLILPGLQAINAPIPLGGTSNHFRASDLHDLQGWDAFNVTEDCDLGMRLVKRGYRTALLDSTTWEEANSAYRNWFWQRTRWIKGYMQTYFVHMRHPLQFLRSGNKLHLVFFQLVVGGKIMSLFINPLMWLLTLIYVVARPVVGPALEGIFPAPILYLGTTALVFGNFLYLYYYMIGCAKRQQYHLIKYAFGMPVYWLAMSAAAWVAVYKLIRRPHQWSKTKHGLHLKPALPHPGETGPAGKPVMAGPAERSIEVNG